MTFRPALALIGDSFYTRLYRDLQNNSRRRKINADRLAVVRAVMKLPEKVPFGWEHIISQAQLDEAREIAISIESYLHGDQLYYDYAPKIVVLHGSYGSKQ